MPFDRRQSIRASAVLAVCLLATPGLARDRGAPNCAATPVALSQDLASGLVAEAARWLGSGNMTGTIGPWCADAVSFWLRRTGHRPLANRLAASALSYGPLLPSPRVGALAVMSTRRGRYGHVGIVEAIELDGSIRLISGNWGHRVARSIVARRTIVAFVEVR